MGCHTWFFRPIKEGEKAVDYCEYGNNYTDEDIDLHDTFRKGGYLEDVLLSFKQTLEFCKENEVDLNENQITTLKEFFEKYPDGIIEFG